MIQLHATAELLTCIIRKTRRFSVEKNQILHCFPPNERVMIWYVCECFAALKSRNANFSRKCTSKCFFLHILSLLRAIFVTLVGCKQTGTSRRERQLSVNQTEGFFYGCKTHTAALIAIIMSSTGLCF